MVINRLADESSPYLRQHAENPVDWYPWGDQAFAEARRRDVPIFLSVGYSSCHWCHVMAPGLAALSHVSALQSPHQRGECGQDRMRSSHSFPTWEDWSSERRPASCCHSRGPWPREGARPRWCARAERPNRRPPVYRPDRSLDPPTTPRPCADSRPLPSRTASSSAARHCLSPCPVASRHPARRRGGPPGCSPEALTAACAVDPARRRPDTPPLGLCWPDIP